MVALLSSVLHICIAQLRDNNKLLFFASAQFKWLIGGKQQVQEGPASVSGAIKYANSRLKPGSCITAKSQKCLPRFRSIYFTYLDIFAFIRAEVRRIVLRDTIKLMNPKANL